MRTILLFLLITSQSNFVLAQTTVIPDANFEQALINLGYDFGTPDGTVLTAQIDTVEALNVMNDSIGDLTGIEDFKALSELNCGGNFLSSIDLSQNSALKFLRCNNNQLTNLDVSHNVDLNLLNCRNNQIDSLNVSQNISLSALFCSFNQIMNLDLSQNDSLVYLDCSSNLISNLDLSLNLKLAFLRCSDNLIRTVDASQNVLLTDLYCEENQLTDLDLSQNNQLTILHCFSNQLVCLNVKNGNNINIFPNGLDARNNPALTCIEVDDPSWSAAYWPNVASPVLFNLNCAPCAVGINESKFSNFNSYPNPTTGNITIDLGETYENIRVKLTNSMGQVLLDKKFGSTNHFSIDIDAPTGIFNLLVETGKGKPSIMKIYKK